MSEGNAMSGRRSEHTWARRHETAATADTFSSLFGLQPVAFREKIPSLMGVGKNIACHNLIVYVIWKRLSCSSFFVSLILLSLSRSLFESIPILLRETLQLCVFVIFFLTAHNIGNSKIRGTIRDPNLLLWLWLSFWGLSVCPNLDDQYPDWRSSSFGSLFFSPPEWLNQPRSSKQHMIALRHYFPL